MIKTLALLPLFFLTINLQAQYKDWTDAEIYLKDGTVLKGKARLTMLESKNNGSVTSIFLKEYLRYINFEIKQKKSTKFTPEEVDKVIFEVNEKIKGRRIKRKATYITIVKKKKRNKVQLGFAELIIDGKIKLVKRTVSDDGRGTVFKESLLIRNEEEAVIFNYIELKSFKKRASEYFDDCPDLISRINKKRYNRKNLQAIVKFYNDNCAK